MANTKRKQHPAPIIKPLRTEYGAGMFPGFPRSIEGAMKSMWGMIVERREYNNGAVYDRHDPNPKREALGRIRMTPTGWVIECPALMKGRKLIRRVK